MELHLAQNTANKQCKHQTVEPGKVRLIDFIFDDADGY